MNLCQYKHILGVPKKGFHVHFMGFAIFDILGTLLIAYLISKKHVIRNFILLVLLAIFLHWLFCVPTRLNKILGLA